MSALIGLIGLDVKLHHNNPTNIASIVTDSVPSSDTNIWLGSHFLIAHTHTHLKFMEQGATKFLFLDFGGR